MATVFFVTNVIIAITYGLLAVYFAHRTKLPRGGWRTGWRIGIAWIFLVLFFVGCVHTHIELAILVYQGLAAPQWLAWHSVASHILQAVGGLAFWILAMKWVKLSIIDKVTYDREMETIVREIQEERKNGK